MLPLVPLGGAWRVIGEPDSSVPSHSALASVVRMMAPLSEVAVKSTVSP
jgi:hypothetical protein